MVANPRVAGFLGRALRHELGAVQQYLTQASLCALQGREQDAGYFRREAAEELGHAERIIRRMLLLGLAPNATQLDAVRPGRDLVNMLKRDRELELDAVRLYDEAQRVSVLLRDAESGRLFAELRADEEGHLAEIEGRLAACLEHGGQHG